MDATTIPTTMTDRQSEIPIPKYSLGAQVFSFSVHQSSQQLPCPDCRDTKQWTVMTPAGESFTVSCQRCGRHYSSDLPTSLYRQTWTPMVRALTIGQIKIETPQVSSWDQDDVHYMCNETGIGSGNVYGESTLFATEAEALARATEEATAKKAAWEAKPEQQRSGGLASLTYRQSLGEHARDVMWSTAYHFGKLREKLESFLDEGSDDGKKIELNDSQRDLLQSEIDRMHWHLDGQQNPVVALAEALRAVSPEHPALARVSFLLKPHTETEVTL